MKRGLERHPGASRYILPDSRPNPRRLPDQPDGEPDRLTGEPSRRILPEPRYGRPHGALRAGTCGEYRNPPVAPTIERGASGRILPD